MSSAAEILQQLYAAGFDIQVLDRYPNAIVVSRGDAMILLENTPSGLRPLGTPGWKMGELMGVLTTNNGRKVFQYKSEIVEASPEKLKTIEQFRTDLETILAGKPS